MQGSTETIDKKRYYVQSGFKLPSVTTIIDLAYQKEWMRAYIAKQMAEEAANGVSSTPEEFLYAADKHRRDSSEYGDDIHNRLNILALGGESGFEPLDRWREAYNPEFIYTEAQVYDFDVGYAGSLDIIAKIDGKFHLIDLKTGNHLDSALKLQLVAYKNAKYIRNRGQELHEMPIIDVCSVLWMPRRNPDDWTFREVPVNNRDYKAFLSCVDVANYHIANSNMNVLGKEVSRG